MTFPNFWISKFYGGACSQTPQEGGALWPLYCHSGLINFNHPSWQQGMGTRNTELVLQSTDVLSACILGKRQREITFFKSKVFASDITLSGYLQYSTSWNWPNIKILHDCIICFAVGEKFRWFYENVGEEKTQYSCSEVCDLIERYLSLMF